MSPGKISTISDPGVSSNISHLPPMVLAFDILLEKYLSQFIKNSAMLGGLIQNQVKLMNKHCQAKDLPSQVVLCWNYECFL